MVITPPSMRIPPKIYLATSANLLKEKSVNMVSDMAVRIKWEPASAVILIASQVGKTAHCRC